MYVDNFAWCRINLVWEVRGLENVASCSPWASLIVPAVHRHSRPHEHSIIQQSDYGMIAFLIIFL